MGQQDARERRIQATAEGAGLHILHFPADYGSNYFTTYRSRSVGGAGSFNFNFFVPSNFVSLQKLVAVGAPVGNFAAATIGLEANYGAVGESAGQHNDTDTLLNQAGVADVFQEIDCMGAVPNLAAGDYVGLNIDHQGIGTTIHYLALLMEYLAQ